MSEAKERMQKLVAGLSGLSAERKAKARVRAASVDRVRKALAKVPTKKRAPVAARAAEVVARATARVEVAANDPLGMLRVEVLACQKCPHLAESRTQVVFGVGNPHADLMFVGEAPGADEDRVGEPFVGRAGQLLTRIIETMGLSRDRVFIGNVLKCRPDMESGKSGNRPPTPSEMQTCLPYLLEQIRIIRPKVIVALGRVAMEGLFGPGISISSALGVWHNLKVPAGAGGGEEFEVPVMPTYHPAYLLRNQAPSEKVKVWKTMLQVMERMEMPISEKQRNYFR